MGHWSEVLVDELAEMVEGDPDRDDLKQLLEQVGREIDVLSGRRFHPVRRTTSMFTPNGLPFVDVPDVHIRKTKSASDVWAIPDSVQPDISTVMQVASLAAPQGPAAPVAEALWTAGLITADASAGRLLTSDHVLQWLTMNFDRDQRMELFRQVMDSTVHFIVPILTAMGSGWWFQISRRLIWITDGVWDDEVLLYEPLIDRSGEGGPTLPLAAGVPVLIAARMTQQPVDWAFSARIWPEGVRLSHDRQWRVLASAVHGHGVPTITVDPASTPAEVGCQMVLKGYWHSYIGGGEPALAHAIAAAYPRQVARIQRATDAPSAVAAATTLLGQLVRPGFDPAQGAEATRRYVRRKANIVVMEHRKQQAPERYPWTQLGISERRYYKLLPQFARKVNGRYDLDQPEIVEKMKAHLDGRDHDHDIRMYAIDLLRSRGFSEAAARKWLQRHPPAQAVDAWPRGAHRP